MRLQNIYLLRHTWWEGFDFPSVLCLGIYLWNILCQLLWKIANINLTKNGSIWWPNFSINLSLLLFSRFTFVEPLYIRVSNGPGRTGPLIYLRPVGPQARRAWRVCGPGWRAGVKIKIIFNFEGKGIRTPSLMEP